MTPYVNSSAICSCAANCFARVPMAPDNYFRVGLCACGECGSIRFIYIADRGAWFRAGTCALEMVLDDMDPIKDAPGLPFRDWKSAFPEFCREFEKGRNRDSPSVF